MQQIQSLLKSDKIHVVKSELELQQKYPLFHQSINSNHSQQYYLLQKCYNGLYEKICRECQKSNKIFNILFYIDEKNEELYININQTEIQRISEYLPLNYISILHQQNKTIYKVIHNQTKLESQRSSIQLLPNQNIVQGRFSNTGIPIQIPSKIYYNGNNCFELNYAVDKYCVSTQASIPQSYYMGEINDRLNPIGEGFFKNPCFKITSKFQEGFFLGPIQITQIPENLSKTIIRNNEKTLLPICYQKDNLIDFYTFQTIFEGRWINQKVLDYYLQQAGVEMMKLSKNISETQKYQSYVINSCDCADIFSSDIFEQLYYSEEQWKRYKEIYNIDIHNEKNRFIFALNIGKSHFIVLVLEQYQKNQGTIYLLDSIPNYFNEQQFQIGIANINGLFPHLKIHQQIIRITQIEHQKNGYDCGIHCIYNSLLVLKQYNREIQQISFLIEDKQKISRLRRHIYFVMVNNYAHWLNY